MKRLFFALLFILVLGFVPVAHALPSLVPLGGDLIWDPAQNITWYNPVSSPP